MADRSPMFYIVFPCVVVLMLAVANQLNPESTFSNTDASEKATAQPVFDNEGKYLGTKGNVTNGVVLANSNSETINVVGDGLRNGLLIIATLALVAGVGLGIRVFGSGLSEGAGQRVFTYLMVLPTFALGSYYGFELFTKVPFGIGTFIWLALTGMLMYGLLMTSKLGSASA